MIFIGREIKSSACPDEHDSERISDVKADDDDDDKEKRRVFLLLVKPIRDVRDLIVNPGLNSLVAMGIDLARHDCCCCRLPAESLRSTTAVNASTVEVSSSSLVSDNDLPFTSLENRRRRPRRLLLALSFVISFVSIFVWLGIFSSFSFSLSLSLPRSRFPFSRSVKWDGNQCWVRAQRKIFFRLGILHNFDVARESSEHWWVCWMCEARKSMPIEKLCQEKKETHKDKRWAWQAVIHFQAPSVGKSYMKKEKRDDPWVTSAARDESMPGELTWSSQVLRSLFSLSILSLCFFSLTLFSLLFVIFSALIDIQALMITTWHTKGDGKWARLGNPAYVCFLLATTEHWRESISFFFRF